MSSTPNSTVGPLRGAGRKAPRGFLPPLLAAAFLACFALLAASASRGWTKDLDEQALRALRSPGEPARPVGPAWVGPAAKTLSALGSGAVLLVVTASAAAALFGARRPSAAWRLIASGVGGFVMSEGIKHLIARPRPSCVPLLEAVASPSFPSSHALLSTAVYLTIAAIVAGTPARPRTKAAVWVVAAVVALIVGFTRTVLGVHYPTDVLGGWAGGLAWMLLCQAVARGLGRRGPPVKA